MLNTNKYMETYSDSELEDISDVIRNGKISIIRGNILEEFEKEAAIFMGHNYGLATCNGTAAIYLALYVAGVKAGDEVILPVYAFHAMGVAICQLGAVPVFCDIDKNTLAIDLIKAETLITEKTKVVLVLQPWGNVANIDNMIKLKRKHPQITFISDSSHAHGAAWDGKPLGRYFDIIAASFGKGKSISGGELGILTTDNKTMYEKAMQSAHVNRVPMDLTIPSFKQIDNAVGLKMRPHGIALKLALINLKKYPKYFQKITENIQKFENKLQETEIFYCAQKHPKATRSYWKFPVFINNKSENMIEKLLFHLSEAGIEAETNNYSKLLNENTIFTQHYKIGIQNSVFIEALSVKNQIIQLPEFLFFYDENVEFIFNQLSVFAENFTKGN